MEVVYRLSTCRSGVNHHPITVVEVFLASQPLHQQLNPAEELDLRFSGLVQRLDMFAWNHKNMGGRLWVDIAKCD